MSLTPSFPQNSEILEHHAHRRVRQPEDLRNLVECRGRPPTRSEVVFKEEQRRDVRPRCPGHKSCQNLSQKSKRKLDEHNDLAEELGVGRRPPTRP